MVLKATNAHPKKRILVVRLSSLGDVILATAALEAIGSTRERSQVDWVVAREYAELLRGNPGVSRVWEYDRGSGLRGWITLIRRLRHEGYSEIIDLHGSLRSRLLRLLFLVPGSALVSNARGGRSAALWPKGCGRSISKQRLRLWGYFAFKKRWPRSWRPAPFVMRYALAGGGTGAERPNLRYLVKATELPRELEGKQYLCVMPGSRWDGKKWPVSSYSSALRGIPVAMVVLGGSSDRESLELVELLKAQGNEVISGVGRWSLSQAACVLSSSLGYFGNDTGLAHLAEAVGRPAAMVLGPTVADMGFGPWREDSLTLGMELGCRPCSKDGRRCFRKDDLYLCIKGLDSRQVQSKLQPWIEARRR